MNSWCCSPSGADCCDDAFQMDMGTLLIPASTTSSNSTSTATATTTATVTAGTTRIKDSGTESRTTAVGAAVGAALGACLLAALGTILFQRRTYKKKLQEMQQIQTTPVYYCAHTTAETPSELPLNPKPAVFELGEERQQDPAGRSP
ncbi:hypothetical protein EYZ11_013561 [Aspergillus tanneri]|nr:hypothetical protein EYZ11_013561 [Aspergillus tanneri]